MKDFIYITLIVLSFVYTFYEAHNIRAEIGINSMVMEFHKGDHVRADE